jgi:hypothetical protein
MTDPRYLTRTGVATKGYPGIERVQFRENPAASNALAQVDEWLRRRFGARSPLAERAVTWGDLVTYGFAKLQEPGGSVLPGTGAGGGSTPDPVPVPTDPSLDPRVPPAPTGLNGAGAAMTIILDWDEPTFSYFGHTEVWRSDTDNLSVAVNIGETQSFIYADVVGAGGLTYYYWVRHISAAGKPGPFNAVAGTEVTTGQVGTGDIAAGTIVADHMTAGSITAANAALADAVVTRAKIDLLAVDDARIENLSVAKLVAGSLAVGQYIQSANYSAGTLGFRINADGTAEFSNLTARGNIAANSITAGATISSPVITGGTINSTTLNTVTLNGGYIYGSVVSSNVINMNAAAGGIFLRAGTFTYYGPYAGSHYPLELKTDGTGFFARGVISGGQKLASGTYSFAAGTEPSVNLNSPPPEDGAASGP